VIEFVVDDAQRMISITRSELKHRARLIEEFMDPRIAGRGREYLMRRGILSRIACTKSRYGAKSGWKFRGLGFGAGIGLFVGVGIWCSRGDCGRHGRVPSHAKKGTAGILPGMGGSAGCAWGGGRCLAGIRKEYHAAKLSAACLRKVVGKPEERIVAVTESAAIVKARAVCRRSEGHFALGFDE